MPVPDYQTLMRPALARLADGEAWTTAVLREEVAEALGLSPEERQETIPSGSFLFDNRVHWALTYMSQAGLLARPRRGVVQITDRGRLILNEQRDRIDNDVLQEFQEFRDFKTRARASQRRVGAFEERSDATPRETISAAVEEANEAVASELLSRVIASDPVFLERLVLQLLTAMGYGGAAGSAEHLGRVGDKGLDGVIRQDPLGLDRIYVQAKRYSDRSVGRPEIQAFVGALHGAQADRGIFVTTGRFAAEAVDYAERVAARLILIDGPTLSRYMVKHNVGVQEDEVYVIKRLDEDFFDV